MPRIRVPTLWWIPAAASLSHHISRIVRSDFEFMREVTLGYLCWPRSKRLQPGPANPMAMAVPRLAWSGSDSRVAFVEHFPFERACSRTNRLGIGRGTDHPAIENIVEDACPPFSKFRSVLGREDLPSMDLLVDSGLSATLQNRTLHFGALSRTMVIPRD